MEQGNIPCGVWSPLPEWSMKNEMVHKGGEGVLRRAWRRNEVALGGERGEQVVVELGQLLGSSRLLEFREEEKPDRNILHCVADSIVVWGKGPSIPVRIQAFPPLQWTSCARGCRAICTEADRDG